ncbi:DUF4124 domain-containing protein [Lysobacter arvi]|uniref:DUF4124 domain-containing protein n=1 Tax=Lysobacter arvi TaxID=3038776 RepID=A0ABU1C9N8_9GAMM|nr:DUF4124 domain-containing protein [Lysobacter arvi]MDR0181853.1 DUF4124 domain-containing protein [Lysobacter arvi]
MHRRREYARILWLLMALPCTLAVAGSVHKCVGPNGVASYQDVPCGRDMREATHWEAPSDPPPSNAAPPSAPVRERASARPARSPGSRVVRSEARPSECEAAKANRDRTLERVGLKRTFDLLSRLDEQVRNACRGR